MVLKKTFIIFFFASGILFSQSSSNSSIEMKPHSNLIIDEFLQEGNYSNSVKKNILKLEQSINEKTNELEKLHTRIIETNEALKNKISIPEEMPYLDLSGNIQRVSSREVEISFEDEKIKEVKIISRKMNLTNDLYSIIRTVTFNPKNLESIKIKVEQFDSKISREPELEDYKNMPLEVKFEALKAINEILAGDIFRFVIIIRKNGVKKIINGRKNFKDL